MGNTQVGAVNPTELSGPLGDLMQKMGGKEDGRAWFERLKRMTNSPLPSAIVKNPVWRLPPVEQDTDTVYFPRSSEEMYKYLTHNGTILDNTKWILSHPEFFPDVYSPGVRTSEVFVLGLPVVDFFPAISQFGSRSYTALLSCLPMLGLEMCTPLTALRLVEKAARENYFGQFLIGTTPYLCGRGEQKKPRLLRVKFPDHNPRQLVSGDPIDLSVDVSGGQVIFFEMKGPAAQ